MINPEDYWDWRAFKGSPACLKLNRRDLANLRQALCYVPGCTAAVQAGGNLGIFPKYLSAEFDTVYTFEPSPELFPLLCHNAPESNIIKLQAALGFKRELVRTVCERRYRRHMPTHEGITHVQPGGSVPTLHIDDLALDRCDLIYLDIEGYEHQALLGAGTTIDVCRPVIACEVNDCIALVGDNADHMEAYIKAHGYVLKTTAGADRIYIPEERA